MKNSVLCLFVLLLCNCKPETSSLFFCQHKQGDQCVPPLHKYSLFYQVDNPTMTQTTADYLKSFATKQLCWQLPKPTQKINHIQFQVAETERSCLQKNSSSHLAGCSQLTILLNCYFKSELEKPYSLLPPANFLVLLKSEKGIQKRRLSIEVQ